MRRVGMWEYAMVSGQAANLVVMKGYEMVAMKVVWKVYSKALK